MIDIAGRLNQKRIGDLVPKSLLFHEGGQADKNTKVVSIIAGVLPVVAITWHFVAIGIAAGVGLAVFLVVISAIGGGP